MMHFHLRVHRWVVWWFYVGVICGAIAVVNLLGHDLSRAQDRIIILVGVAHWLLGGIVCWAFEGVKFEPHRHEQSPSQRQLQAVEERHSHPASDFLLPGGRRSLLPWRH